MRQMSLRESEELLPPRERYFKECLILETVKISETYVYVEVQLPPPHGGTHTEIVEWDTTVDVDM